MLEAENKVYKKENNFKSHKINAIPRKQIQETLHFLWHSKTKMLLSQYKQVHKDFYSENEKLLLKFPRDINKRQTSCFRLGRFNIF